LKDKPIFDVAGLAETCLVKLPNLKFASGDEEPVRASPASRRTRWARALWDNPKPKRLPYIGGPILPLDKKRPYPDKATQQKWKAEEPDLIRKVKAGDPRAARELVLRHLPNLQHKYGSRLSAALEGFWRAVTLFDPDSFGNGLWAYVRWEIHAQTSLYRRFVLTDKRRDKTERPTIWWEGPEILGFGDSSYGVLYGGNVPTGVSSDPGAEESTGGKAPRRQGAETYKKDYCSNGVSQYSRNIAAHKQDFIHIRLSNDAEQRALRRLRWMGRRAYADWLVNRKTTCPPPANETPAPYVSKIAAHYRNKGWHLAAGNGWALNEQIERHLAWKAGATTKQIRKVA
jgi:hypothetical protein